MPRSAQKCDKYLFLVVWFDQCHWPKIMSSLLNVPSLSIVAVNVVPGVMIVGAIAHRRGLNPVATTNVMIGIQNYEHNHEYVPV